MNNKIGLYITYLVYLFTFLGISYSLIHPIVANAWFFDKPEVIKEEVVIPKTLDSEIDRLSIKYNIASSTARAIIKCESQMYGSAVNYNRLPDGTVWSEDRGPFQINDYFHKDTMTKLGLDYYDQFDSLEYGFILLSSQGVGPWKASRACWIKLI
jgi:hypothetical protein